MSSLIENLEKAAEANEALTALIKEAHSTIKALRQAERDVRDTLNKAREDAKELADIATSESLAPAIEQMTVVVQEELDRVTAQTLKEYEKVASPLMSTLDLLRAHIEEISSDLPGKNFFDRR